MTISFAHHQFPPAVIRQRPERFVSEDAEGAAGCEMALDVERVVDGGVNGQEALS
jgi:hypothetical protein